MNSPQITKIKIGDKVKPKNNGYWKGAEGFCENTYEVIEVFPQNTIRCVCIDDDSNETLDELTVHALIAFGHISNVSELQKVDRPKELLGIIEEFEKL